MKYRLHYIVVIAFLVTTCRDKETKEFLERYSKIIVEYPSELTDHFPHQFKTIGQFSAITPAGAYAHDMAFFCLWIDTDSVEIGDVKRRLKKIKAREFTPRDSSLIIVGDTVDYSKKVDGIPIPSFEKYEKDTRLNSIRLDSGFTIHVLESKSGEFMSKEELTTDNKLPPDWKNGFSRGLAINEEEKRILYWLTIW